MIKIKSGKYYEIEDGKVVAIHETWPPAEAVSEIAAVAEEVPDYLVGLDDVERPTL